MMHAIILRADSAEVALVASAVDLGVAVERFAPEPPLREAHAIAVAHGGGQIEDYQQGLLALPGLPDKRNDAAFVVRAVDPKESFVFKIGIPEAGFSPIQPI